MFPKSRALKADGVDSNRCHIKAGIQKIRGRIRVDPRIAADHGKRANSRKLVNDYPARYERTILHLDVTGNQRATRNYDMVTDLRVMRDVTRRHDVVVVADGGSGVRLGSPRNRVMFPYLVAVSDPQITALAGEVLVERIGTENRSRRDLIPISHRCPSFHEYVGLQQATATNRDVGLNDAEITDHTLGSNDSVRMNARSWSN